MRYLRLMGYAAASLAVLGLAGGGRPATAAEATEAVAKLTPEQHYAKGEVRCGDEWVPILKLFKDYREARFELEAAEKRGDDVKGRLAERQRELAQLKSESTAEERPVRFELGKARNKLREYNRALDQKPPVKPELRPMPAAPKRPSTYSGSSSNTYSSSTNRYDDLRREWQRQCDVIKEENDQKLKRWQQEITLFKKTQDEANAEKPKVEAQIKELEGQLAKIGEDLEAKQAPTANQAKAVNEQALTANRQVSVIETRLETLAEALRAAPEDLRLKNGIVEWEKRFYSVSEMEREYTTTQAEIDKARDALKADAEKVGLPWPEDWRHPQQDRMDAIKAGIDKVRAAQSGK